MAHNIVSEAVASVASRDKVKVNYGFFDLLTPPGYNPKTLKGEASGYQTGIMHFAPAHIGGFEVCQYRTPGCTASCLHTAGRGGFDPEIEPARIARKVLFFQHRAAFNALLIKEVRQLRRRALAHNMKPAVRLNGTSDLPWERLAIGPNGETILALFPDVQFYDYTKNPHRAIANAKGEHPANYALTFSLADGNRAYADAVLAAGGNIAAVFAGDTLPDIYNGYRVINGDEHDLRFLDPRGVIVGLKAKGKAKHDHSGFVIRDATTHPTVARAA